MKRKVDITGSLPIEEYPIGSKLCMTGGNVKSVWRVDSHITDEDGVVVKVKIVRDNKSLNNMSAEIFAGNTSYTPMVDAPVEDEMGEDDPIPESPSSTPDADAKAGEKTNEKSGPKESRKDGRKKILNTSEISDRTGMSNKDILAAISNGDLKAEKQGRTYAAGVKEVDEWAKAVRAKAREQERAQKAAEKASKPAPVKPVKAVKDITGEKDGVDFSSRGKHLKVPIREVSVGKFKPDPRNPFPVGGRLHGYFQPFIDGGGEASYDDLWKSYIRIKGLLRMGGDETEESVKRDLDNHFSAWMSDKVGPRGLHLRIERIDNVGRVPRGKKGAMRYRLIGFKEGSPYLEKAVEMGW